MTEIILAITAVLLAITTLIYMRMFNAELDKRLKHEVEVKDLILEHNRITDSMRGNAYTR